MPKKKARKRPMTTREAGKKRWRGVPKKDRIAHARMMRRTPVKESA